MLTNASVAGGPQELQSTLQASTVFFGPTSGSQTSQTFKVTTAPFFISAYNLANGDLITVQQVIGDGSGTEVANFAPVIGPVQLSPTMTCVRIDYPGRYRLVHSGPSALGTFTVVGAPQIMSSDSLAGLAQALATAITNLGTTVTGTAPIVVTPTGFNYNVALDTGGGGGINTNTLGWDYTDLGTITSSPLNINWGTKRAYKFTVNVGGLLDVNIHNVLPNSPGFMWIMVTQGPGGDTVQFTGAAPPIVNAGGTILPASSAGATTVYQFYFDGTNIWLDDFTSTTPEIGRFSGNSLDVIGGDNVTRSFDSYHRNAVLGTLAFGTDTYTCSFNPPLIALVSYQVYNVIFQNANTGAATLNPDTLGAKPILRRGAPVTAGQIPAGAALSLLYTPGGNLEIIGAA